MTPCGDGKEIRIPKSACPSHGPLDCQTNPSGKGQVRVCPSLPARANSHRKSQRRMWMGRGWWCATQFGPEESSDLLGISALIGSFRKITIQRKTIKIGIYILWEFKKRQVTSKGFYRITHLAAAIVPGVLAQETRREQLK